MYLICACLIYKFSKFYFFFFIFLFLFFIFVSLLLQIIVHIMIINFHINNCLSSNSLLQSYLSRWTIKLMVEHWLEVMYVQIGLGSLDGNLGHLPRFVLTVASIPYQQADADVLISVPRQLCKKISYPFLCIVFVTGCAEWSLDCF